MPKVYLYLRANADPGVRENVMRDSRKCEEGGQMITVNTWQHVAIIIPRLMEITSQIFSLAAGKRDYCESFWGDERDELKPNFDA